MDREHVRGAADKAKGAIKEVAGKVAGDEDCGPKGSSIRRQALFTTPRATRGRFAQCIKGRLIYKLF